MSAPRYLLLCRQPRVPSCGPLRSTLRSDGVMAAADSPATHLSTKDDSSRPGAILIRKQAGSRIINVWLLLIVLLGAVIALGDGLTRFEIAEREASWNGPLEYEPYAGAFLLAGAAFPLMILYARKAKVSMTEGVFLWFVFCTAAYTRDFSYLRWPGTPLFVTDVVLLVLLLSAYLPSQLVNRSVPFPVIMFLLWFLGAGALSAARGFAGHHEAVVVLRDSALAAYALFLLVGYHFLRSWRSIKRAAVWFLLGAALNTLNGLAWSVVAPEQRRFIYPGIYILVSLVGLLMAMASRLVRPHVALIFAGVLSLGLLLANARSLFISFGIVFMVAVLVPGLRPRKIRAARQVVPLGAAVLVCLSAFLVLRAQAGQDFANRAESDLVSGILHSSEDADWQFRLSAWKEAWKRFGDSPLAGEGFGIPFAFDIWDNDPRPHNTFLTVLYKMGLIGFLPLVAFLGYFFWASMRAVRRNLKNQRVVFLQIVVLAQGAFCLFGAANLMLESPYLASLLWVSLGVGLRMIRMLDLERLVRERGYRVQRLLAFSQ